MNIEAWRGTSQGVVRRAVGTCARGSSHYRRRIYATCWCLPTNDRLQCSEWVLSVSLIRCHVVG